MSPLRGFILAQRRSPQLPLWAKFFRPSGTNGFAITVSLKARLLEVNLSPEFPAKLAQAAAENNSDAEEYVRQLVEHYLDHDAGFREKVTAGLAGLDRGEFIRHEEMRARIDELRDPLAFEFASTLDSFSCPRREE